MHAQSGPALVAPDNPDATFEALLTKVAASFVDVEPEALDGKIIDALRSIVLFLGIDRSTLGRFDDPQGEMMPTHSWAVEGLEPLPSPMYESHFPYLIPRLRAGIPAIFERITSLPPEAAADVAALRRIGLKSIAAFPVSAEGAVIGWLSFGAMRAERTWPERLVRRLRLMADIFANALSRRRKDAALHRALADNLRLRAQLEAENAVWREEVLHAHDLEEIVGESPQLQRVLLQVEQVALTDSTVLILGETGTGKERIAAAIHRRSPRANQPLVQVNCAALPASLIESELFGHEKGAFTGALKERPGRFELADGGTLVLDEIGELPLELQAKLLRVLQNGEFERLGSIKTRRTNARVIAATNRDLAAAVEHGTFRADLFYRLGVFPITLPPLRERREDIPLLVAYFVEKLRGKLGRPALRVTEHAIAALMAYHWPGNVRQLANIVERSMIVSPGPELEVDGLPCTSEHPESMAGGANGVATAPRRTLAEVERDYIRAVCAGCGWKINGPGGAAEILALKPNTLRSRMKKLGVVRPRSADAAAEPASEL